MLSISLASMVDEVAQQEGVVGFFLVGFGLVYILMGIRMSRALVGLSYGVLGFVVGASISGPPLARVAVGLVVGMALCLASAWTLRPSVAVLSGLWAGFLVFTLAAQCKIDAHLCLLMGGVFFIAAASLTFVSFYELTAMVTSLEGTLLFLGGLVVLCNQYAIAWAHFRSLLVGNPVFAPFLLLSGTVAGFYTQMAELQKKQAGHSA